MVDGGLGGRHAYLVESLGSTRIVYLYQRGYSSAENRGTTIIGRDHLKKVLVRFQIHAKSMKVGLPSTLTAAEAQPFFFRPFLFRSFNFVDNVLERLWAIYKDSRLPFVFRQLTLEYFPSLI